MMAAQGLKIGELARQVGISVGALRYYDDLGLVPSRRGSNGYRYYPPDAVHRVQFIKKAQALGFSLEDIGEILTLYGQGQVPCALVQARLQEKIDQLAAQIREMQQFKTSLETYRDLWADQETVPQPGDICPLIEGIPVP